MTTMTIELDCAPGAARPSEYIGRVVRGTVLEKHTDPVNPASAFFGNWTWDYTGKVTEAEWRMAQELIKVRIANLYNAGAIRYGSW